MRGHPLKIIRMFVYILQSLKDGKYYIGSTGNINKRIQRHNLGMVKSTKYRRPLVLAYLEEMANSSEARRRETEIKKMKGGIQFKVLLKNAAVVQR